MFSRSVSTSSPSFTYVKHTFFYKQSIKFSEPNVFSDLNLPILLKYYYFSRSATLLTVSEKSPARKSCISRKIKQIKNEGKTF